MTREEFVARWDRRRAVFQRFSALVDGAKLCAEVLADFRAVTNEHGDWTLSLTEAAARSGYSAPHLGRLLRAGKIPNAGRPGAPRMRVADLPTRPRATLAGQPPKAYDPATDARSLMSRRKGGAHGTSQPSP